MQTFISDQAPGEALNVFYINWIYWSQVDIFYKYGKKGQNDFKRLGLHAFKIEILNFFGKNLVIESDLPKFIKNYEEDNYFSN